MAYSPYLWPLIVASLCCLGIGFYAGRYPDVPASRPFSAMMWLGSAWTALYALNIAVVDLPLRIFLSTCLYVPTRLIPPMTLILALSYTGRESLLTKRRTVLLFAIPAISILASLTSYYHRLFRFDFWLDARGPVSVLHYTGGSIYWISTLYGTVLVVAALALLARSLGDRALRLGNTLLIFIGLLVPVIFDVLFSVGITPIPGYSFAPSALMVTAVAYLWALFRNRLFSIASIARSTVVDNIEDLVIVFDTRGHVIDFNSAAQSFCALDPRRSVGATADSLGAPWSDFFRECERVTSCKEEVSIVMDGTERFFDLTVSPIEDHRKSIVGRLFVLHDVSERRRSQRQIQRLLEEKELLLREVHHRIKNNMNVMASILSLQADTLKDTPAHEAILEAKRRVVSMMVLYDRLYRNSGRTAMSIHEYLSPLLDKIMNSVGDATIVELKKDIQDFRISTKAMLPIGIIANELLTNAMKHAFVGRDHGVVTVSASLAADGKRAVISIADDGVGLGEEAWSGSSKGFGLQLVGALIQHVEGRLDIRREPNTCFILEFDPGDEGDKAAG